MPNFAASASAELQCQTSPHSAVCKVNRIHRCHCKWRMLLLLLVLPLSLSSPRWFSRGVLALRTCLLIFTYLHTYYCLLSYRLYLLTCLLDMAIVPVTCIVASSSWSDYARMPILSRVAFHAFAEQLAARSMHGKHSCCWCVPAASVAGAIVRCTCSCAHVEFEHGGHHV